MFSADKAVVGAGFGEELVEEIDTISFRELVS